MSSIELTKDEEKQIDELKASSGCHRIVISRCNGVLFAFRPFRRQQLTSLRKSLERAGPEMELELISNAVQFCCVLGKEEWARVVEEAPAWPATVSEELMHVAQGGGSVSIGVR